MTRGASPEDHAREKIDVQLHAAGWQELDSINSSGTGYVTEYPLPNPEGGTDRADYVLLVHGTPFAVVEAKPASKNPYGHLQQAARYGRPIDNGPLDGTSIEYTVPFLFAANGETIWVRDTRPDSPKPRELIQFHTPSGLEQLLSKDYPAAKQQLDTLTLDDIDPKLWEHQTECINAIDTALHQNKSRILAQMATGSGKTRAAMTQSYRLLESGYANRILFIADTRKLADQAYTSFKNHRVNGGQFRDLYSIGNLEKEQEYERHHVVVTTLQKVYTLIDGGRLDFSPHDFDVIVTDECHRSIYKEDGYGMVLDLFDAIEIGLTATPDKRTLGRFGGVNVRLDSTYDHPDDATPEELGGLQFQYSYDDAVRDERVVPYRFHQIDTAISMDGFELNGEFYTPNQLGRTYSADGFHRAVAEEIREHTNDDELTLVFARRDSHADAIVEDFREVYSDKPDEFIQKITYEADKPSDLLRQFKSERKNPRIAVTVQMVSTGVDIKPLENIVMLTPVKSHVLYNQMLGRGTRTCERIGKDHFTVFDCVGVLDYFEKMPPFNTMEHGSLDDDGGGTGEGTDGSGDSPFEIAEHIDDVRESNPIFPSETGEKLTAKEYRDRFQEFVQSHADHPVIRPLDPAVDNPPAASEREQLRVLLQTERDCYTQGLLRVAYNEEEAELVDFVAAALRDNNHITNPIERTERARELIKTDYHLTDEAEEWVDEMSEYITACGNIQEADFRTPPLSSRGGWGAACQVFNGEARLREIIDRLEQEYARP
jgi:type I restriction enzyme R subunit